jgi:hypothetical protein
MFGEEVTLADGVVSGSTFVKALIALDKIGYPINGYTPDPDKSIVDGLVSRYQATVIEEDVSVSEPNVVY